MPIVKFKLSESGLLNILKLKRKTKKM